jgi:hypothetical protein
MKRGKGKYTADYKLKDIYEYYIESIQNRKHKAKFEVDYKKFSKIIKAFNKNLSELIITQSYEYIIPYKLGVIRIKKSKQRLYFDKENNLKRWESRVYPDWKKTKELWSNSPVDKEKKTIVYYTNSHTDGYIYRWLYSKYRCRVKSSAAYCFIPCRANKRRLSAEIKNNKNIDYYE